MSDINYTNRGLFTDLYELTMAQGYFDAGRIDEEATFELFFRRNPFTGLHSYVIACGVYDVIKFLNNFNYTAEDISYLSSLNKFSDDFLDYLSKLKFEGKIRGVPEGTLTFPYMPIMQISAPIIPAQLVETAILNIFNYQSLIATKASRVCRATKRENNVLEFGLRRAHADAGIVGSRAAIIGGCASTSNTIAGKFYGVPVAGTQAHSWVQSFETELESFRAYARSFPDNTILLVDTYDTLNQGIPNAIKVGLEMKQRGESLRGIRLDSGDLAWLAIKSAEMLDEAGLKDTKIVLSGGLDEYVIESIINQIRNGGRENKDKQFTENLIDRLLYGVGTALITGEGEDNSALDGVYKLVQVEYQPVIKISENRNKTTNPGKKNLWRIKDTEGNWIADVMGLVNEDTPQEGDTIYHHTEFTKKYKLDECNPEPLYIDLMEKYKDKKEKEVWEESKKRAIEQMNAIDPSHLRFLNPHYYKISLTEKLYQLKRKFINKYD